MTTHGIRYESLRVCKWLLIFPVAWVLAEIADNADTVGRKAGRVFDSMTRWADK